MLKPYFVGAAHGSSIDITVYVQAAFWKRSLEFWGWKTTVSYRLPGQLDNFFFQESNRGYSLRERETNKIVKMEVGRDEQQLEKEKGSFERERGQKIMCSIPKSMREIVFAILVTVAAAFTVKGIEVLVTSAKEGIKPEPVYTG